MKITTLLAAFLLLPLLLRAQQIIPLKEKPYVDSLKTAATGKSADSARAGAMLLLADYYRNAEPKKSQEYLNLAKNLIRENTTLKAQYFFYNGMLQSPQNPRAAEDYFENGRRILINKKDNASLVLLSSLYYNAALLKKNEKGYPYLVETLTEKSIPLAEKAKNAAKTGHLYAQLGNILTYNAEFGKAEEYLSKARSILEKSAPKSAELLLAYLNSCMNFCYQSNGASAKKMLDRAESLIQNHPESTNYPLFLYNKMLYEITMQQVAQALSTADLGIRMSGEKKQKMLLQMFYFNKYDLLRKSGKLAEARAILLSILSDKSLVDDANNRKTVYNELSSLSEQMGNPKDALLWSRQYARVSDSLHESRMKVEINDLETRYRTTEKEKLLAEKNLEINRKNSFVRLFIGTSLLFLMGGIFLYFYFRNKRRLTEQREIILAQKLVEKEKTEELMVTKAILDGEERERQRLAKDLHDGLGGMLAGVKINLSNWASQHLEDDTRGNFHKILTQLDNSVSELRGVARNLMPESLLKFGLEIALQDLCDFYSREDLNIDFQPVTIRRDLSFNTQINIYRIVQELLSNAVKHAAAKNIFVQCAQSGSQFHITVEDDGVGIAAPDYHKIKSMGLTNLQNRVDFLKGKMDIQSQNQQGTTINIELNTDA